jgi:phenylalanyl-tRNA synthetase beta chain
VRIPLTWLREFAPTDLGPEELADLITPRGVLVEDVLHPWEGLEGVVVARVIEVRDHPAADKLCVARIAHGSGEVEVVVGVRNMGPGDLVPWAPPGSRVPEIPEPLEPRELRGVVSNGMLCSSRELGISADHGGILLLNDEGYDVGADLKAALALDDAVLDIEVEPNRPDFLSVYGVAREVAAATGVPIASPDLTIAETGDALAADTASVAIEPQERCSRYVARVILGVTARPSPLRAQARLTACGMRPISSVVDATNYAMLELGQPLHGFDLDLLAGPGIVVRLARDGERLTTLDGVDRELGSDDLLICDLERPVAIAGVMGGATSEVSEQTSSVMLESAHFFRSGVLRTARRLDLHTEASHRFERGTDPEGTDAGAARGAELIAAWSGGQVLRGVAADGSPPSRNWVSIRPQRATALLGYPVDAAQTRGVFDVLGMAHRDDEDRIDVEVPGYRVDVEREVDLIEEVARILGYDRVGSALPRAPHPGGLPDEYALVRTVKDVLVRAGLREVRPAPFVSARDVALTGDEDAIAVANPLRSEEGFLRTRLIPGLVRAIARNQAARARATSIFEVGAVFRAGDPVEERRKIGWAMWGATSEGWHSDGRDFDVLDARGVLEALLDELRVSDWSLGASPQGLFHPGRSAWVLVGGERAGVLGEIHPGRAEELDLTGRVALVELELAVLAAGATKEFIFADVPRFPPVRRDLAFVVAEDTPAGSVSAAVDEAGGDLLGSCVLFDVFRGGSLSDGKKSLAFSVDLRAPDRTMTDEEADEIVERIVARLSSEFDATLRA